jgi:6-pyruvoyltetrahydropterin/6-carboxytetrahydropterin synthase
MHVYRVTTEIHFAYGHRLLDYDGKCAHPHGHNGRVEIELTCDTLDRADMAVDFTVVKHQVQAWVDRHIDHQMILRRDDPLVPVLQQMHEPIYVMDRNPTAESLAALIYEVAAELKFPISCVRFWESPTSYASYEPVSRSAESAVNEVAGATPAR